MVEDDAATPASAEDLRPSYFGTGSNRLFGCVHMPVVARPRSAAVVICNPLGAEYERGHRALRQLAGKLAGAGFPTLRFDYAGTGDSTGDCDDTSPENWESDIDTALHFIKEQAGVTRVIIVGVRLGALLAACHARERRDCLAIALWRPIASGRAMIEEWEQLHGDDLRARGQTALGPDDDSLLGWRMPQAWRDALRAFAMPEWESIPCRTLVLNGGPGDGAPVSPSGTIDTVEDPSGPIWRQDPMNPLVPTASLQVIVEWCGGQHDR